MLLMLYNIINSYERQYRMEKPKYKRILVKLSGEAMRERTAAYLIFAFGKNRGRTDFVH